MMSGQTDPTVRNLALSAGVTQYLTKPLNAGALNMAIVQTLRGHAA
jgi:DNA-binding response OmpR family regulator